MNEGALASPAGFWSTGLALALIVFGVLALAAGPERAASPCTGPTSSSASPCSGRRRRTACPWPCTATWRGGPTIRRGSAISQSCSSLLWAEAQPPVRALVRGAGELRARPVAKGDFVALRGHLARALGPPVRGRFRRRTWFLARAADVETRPVRLPEELLA